MTQFLYAPNVMVKLREEWMVRRAVFLRNMWGTPEPVPLPADEILQPFLEIAYHASLTMEEGRPTRFSLALCASQPSHGILFGQDRPFDVGEVRRLAQAAGQTLHIALVAVGSRLRIAGLLHDAGALPLVTVRGPGTLDVSRDDWTLMRLQGGRVEWPADYAGHFPLGGWAGRFEGAQQEMVERVVGENRFGNACWWPQVYYDKLNTLLRGVESHGHGGAVFVLHEKLTPEQLRPLLRIKYPCDNCALWSQLIEDGDQARPRPSGGKRIELSDLALLTRVDGALLITDRFELLGFGVEAIASSLVSHVRDERSAQLVEVESRGTRHRSAFRLCDACDCVTAFVCSHDGGIRAVWKEAGEVHVTSVGA